MQKGEFGLTVRRLREQAGLSQRELAQRVGVDVSYLSKIENTVLPPPSQEVILKLARVLNADIDELLTLAGKVPADIAQILKNRHVLQSLREGDTAKKSSLSDKADSSDSSFHKKLRELREQAGLSQAELAKMVGVSFTYLSKIENGVKPPPSEKVILRLAEVLKCDKDDLMASAGKVPSDITLILKNREVRQSLRESHARRAIMSGTGNGRGISIMKHLVAGRQLARIALAFILVVAIATSLWFSSPSLVRALKIEITNPTGGTTLPPAAVGQTYYFKLKVTIEDGELLPIQNISLQIYNSANSGIYAYLANLPLVDGGSANYTTGQTGGGAANVTAAATNFNWRIAGGYTVWGGYVYTFPVGYGYGAPTGNATITYTIAWTPPLGWPVGDYKVAAYINANGASFTQVSSLFALTSGVVVVAETSVAQTLSSNVTGVIAIRSNINRIKNVTDNSTATIPGGIGSYSATVTASPGSALQILKVYGVPPFDGPIFDSGTGNFAVPVVVSPIQPSNSGVAEIVAILTGNVTTNVNLNIAYQSIGAAGGGSVPEEFPNSLTLRRGDTTKDGSVDVYDALYIAQYILGQRQVSGIGALNAASVRHDGTNGDRISIYDALFIAQYIVSQRNADFQ